MRRSTIVMLAAALLLGLGPAGAVPAAAQCSCSSNHWLAGGCSMSGPCPCACSCGLFRCSCSCASKQNASPTQG